MADLGTTTGAVFIAKKWIPKLVKMLAGISGERREKLDQISFDFPDPEELARYYVEPYCQRVNPANLPDGKIDEYRKPVFEAINHFLNEPTDRLGASHRIVLGDAGMGKSSLLVMLWKVHLFGFWPKDVECTLLKLGPDTLETIAKISAPSRHILLLDALDEDSSFSPETGGAKARLVELITASTHFRKVIISCRTQFFVDEDSDSTFAKLGTVRLDGFTCPISYLSPFDDAQAQELIEKRFPDTWRRFLFRPNKAREQAMTIADVMGSLSMRPLLLSYIPFLLGDDPSQESPLDLDSADLECEIYRLMMTRWLDREVLKIRARGKAAVVPRSEDLREICWQVATIMKLDGLRKMPRVSFEALKRDLGASEFLAGEIEGRSLLNKDAAGNFRFAHYSIQEFLVVEHCLARGPFIRAADSKCKVAPSDLMQRFYEQRLRGNLRTMLLDSESLFPGDFERLVTRVAFAPADLLLLAKTMAESAASNKLCGDSVLVHLGEGNWANDVRVGVVLAVFVTLGKLSRSHLSKLSNKYNLDLDNLDLSKLHLHKWDKLSKLDLLYLDKLHLYRLHLYKLHLYKLSKSDLLYLDKLDRCNLDLSNLDLSNLHLHLYRSNLDLSNLYNLYNLYKLYKYKLDLLDLSNLDLDLDLDLDNLDLDNLGGLEELITSAVTNLAAQLATGLLNLSFPEARLAQIYVDELPWVAH